jgi:hypothetical protein
MNKLKETTLHIVTYPCQKPSEFQQINFPADLACIGLKEHVNLGQEYMGIYSP